LTRSPACDAVKILCRRRRTRSSTTGQSTANQSKVSSSGPFTTPTAAASATGVRSASNLSLCSSVVSKAFSTSSPDPRQHPFGSRHQPVSGQLSETPAEVPASPRFPVAFRPPALACWVILHPLGHSAFLTDDGPDNSPDPQRDCHVPHDQDSTGEGAPYTPRQTVSPDRERVPQSASPASQRHALHPHPIPIGGSPMTRHQQGFTRVHPSGLPLRL
jgi:hypothetical protein